MPNPAATARVLRAVLSEWGQRVCRQIMVLVGWTGLVLTAAAAGLTVLVSRWWAVLLVAAVILAPVAWLAAWIARALIRRATSAKTPRQRELTGSIVDKLVNAAEVKGTPKVFVAARVVFGLAAKRMSYIEGVMGQAAGAKGEIAELRRSFGDTAFKAE
ncbi:MAG: hypothetical protein LBT54_04165 [Bifidobacteriaceae bacterium]|jgi:hypothetical protein|nr:hypothetical protein [Bifidobacteriaceae bacterium]